MLNSLVRRARRASVTAPPAIGVQQVAQAVDVCTYPLLDLPSILSAEDHSVETRRIITDGRIHASALYNECPRRLAYAVRAAERGQPIMRAVDSTQRIVWEMGRAAEAGVRSRLINAIGRHRVIGGGWACGCGKLDTSVYGCDEPTHVCSKCGGRHANYVELDLKDDDYGITLHPDLMYRELDGIRLVEIKSIKKDAFEKLTAPQVQHKVQAGLYHHRLTAKGYNLLPEYRVLYVCKDYVMRGSVYKDFLVSANDPVSSYAVDRHLRIATQTQIILREGIGDGPPVSEVCPYTPDEVRGKCFFANYCLEGLWL